MPRRDYDEHKRLAADRQAELSKAGREIGPLPKVRDPKRRKRCARNLKLFLETYFPKVFVRGWSDDHLRVLKLVEQAVLEGMLQAVAMPRGSGKSSILQRAALWAVLYGHRRYVVVVCADETKAKKTLAILKSELARSDLLLADFPEVCHAIRKLEGIANRAKGQLYQGKPTNVEWGKGRIVLPSIAGSKASGALLEAAGLEAAVRGAVHLDDAGNQIRPDLALVDDPQTRRSAKSAIQTEQREQLLTADLVGLAGPGEPFSCLVACTVIYPDDLAERILDRTRHPEFRGIRTKLLYSWPKALDLWQKFGEIRADELRSDGDGKLATAFYRKHRRAMDAGGKVAWPERKLPKELSALQHAMTLWLTNPETFASEYQNEPIDKRAEAAELPTAEEICGRTNRLARGRVPLGCQFLTGFIDVQGCYLAWGVCGWRPDFTGSLLDLGAWPDQKRNYFSRADARPTLADAYPKSGPEARIAKGLEDLVGALYGRTWTREDGAELKIDRLLIDANWGDSTDVVYQFCRRSPLPGLWPWHGRAETASSRPWSEYKKKPGETIGHHWRIPNVSRTRAARFVVADVNFWKTFLFGRLVVEPHDPGALTFFGDRPHPIRLVADHLLSEYPVKTSGRGRELTEWKLRPERPDNEFLDVLVGNCVAASMLGVSLGAAVQAEAKAEGRRKKVSLSELRKHAA